MTDYSVAPAIEAIEKRLGELVEQQRLANLIALLNPELATWEHIPTDHIFREVRRWLAKEGA